jgi:hypothetical protein
MPMESRDDALSESDTKKYMGFQASFRKYSD